VTVPAAPLPLVRDLLGMFTAAEFSGATGWSDDLREHSPRFFHRGSVALAAGIEAIGRSLGSPALTVWVPDYFCNEALDLVRRAEVALRFYPVREDLSPDWERFAESPAADGNAQVLVLVHYFGFPNATGEARQFCDQKRMILVEDAAHMLKGAKGMGLGDFVIFSPRKVLALPSGGLLMASSTFVNSVNNQPSQPDLFETAGWIIRRLIQSVLVELRFPWHRFSNYEAAAAAPGEYSSATTLVKPSNSYALKLLTVVSRRLNEVVARRRQNYEQLLGWSRGLKRVRPLCPVLTDDICPYAFPLLVGDGCADVVARLNQLGVLASRWPDLPPELSLAKHEHQVAFKLYDQLMLLPVHQSLQTKQIERMGKALRAVVGQG
jgi:DegT/DnrJ/EryC1/StrS aminotransferase family